jgi:hypothetical protein
MSHTNTTLPTTFWQALQRGLRGELVRPDDPGYEAARRVWNGQIDHRPAAVAYCYERRLPKGGGQEGARQPAGPSRGCAGTVCPCAKGHTPPQ